MAHALGAPSAPAVLRNTELDADAVRQARVDLAACFRMAAPRAGLSRSLRNCERLVGGASSLPAAVRIAEAPSSFS